MEWMQWNALHLGAAAAVFALAGVVKGAIGLGLPTLSMALLVLWMAPAEAAALLLVPSFVTNVWQMRPWTTLGAVWRRTWAFQCAAAAATIGASQAWGAVAGAWSSVALGMCLLAYAAWGGLVAQPWQVTARHARWLGPCAGAVTGVVTAATGVFVLPAVPYLQALGLTRPGLLQAMGLSFTVSTLALGLGLAGQGTLAGAELRLSALMLGPALAGMGLGQWCGRRLSALAFRRVFFLGLGALGGWMLWRACA